jgi:hypothetical protein
MVSGAGVILNGAVLSYLTFLRRTGEGERRVEEGGRREGEGGGRRREEKEGGGRESNTCHHLPAPQQDSNRYPQTLHTKK